uniref:Uncharacterized protein n=1 Tax=Anopheles atroparvus TaxID=41427 RepID=A0A182J3C7_ANOAO
MLADRSIPIAPRAGRPERCDCTRHEPERSEFSSTLHDAQSLPHIMVPRPAQQVSRCHATPEMRRSSRFLPGPPAKQVFYFSPRPARRSATRHTLGRARLVKYRIVRPMLGHGYGSRYFLGPVRPSKYPLRPTHTAGARNAVLAGMLRHCAPPRTHTHTALLLHLACSGCSAARASMLFLSVRSLSLSLSLTRRGSAVRTLTFAPTPSLSFSLSLARVCCGS